VDLKPEGNGLSVLNKILMAEFDRPLSYIVWVSLILTIQYYFR